MTNIAYVNGAYEKIENAKVSIMDRGLLFADGVYEVAGVYNGVIIDNESHIFRLQRSLNEIKLTLPIQLDELLLVQKKLIEINKLKEGTLYFHVTRGIGQTREFEFPEGSSPSLIMFIHHKQIMDLPINRLKAKIMTLPDLRWKRRDIKSIALLPQVLSKQVAHENNCNEVWMYEDGYITEGGSSNAFIIKDNKLISRKNNEKILSGTTRQAVLKLLELEGLSFDERPFTIEEAYDADEAFYTSASVFVMPVISIDNKVINNGMPGNLTLRLRNLYENFAKSSIKKEK